MLLPAACPMRRTAAGACTDWRSCGRPDLAGQTLPAGPFVPDRPRRSGLCSRSNRTAAVWWRCGRLLCPGSSGSTIKTKIPSILWASDHNQISCYIFLQTWCSPFQKSSPRQAVCLGHCCLGVEFSGVQCCRFAPGSSQLAARLSGCCRGRVRARRGTS